MSERDKPMCGHEVAAACGWSPAMMTASKAAGYRFQYGSKTTIRHYLAWRSRNPKFRITSYIKAHSPKQNARVTGLSQRARGHQVASVRNHDEQ